MRPTILCVVLVAAAACKPADRAAKAPVPMRVTVVPGFLTPESVKYDASQDVYFVSNINGNPSAKDNNGFISRVRPDGTIEALKFIEAGRNGVTLNGPKGLALRGDTLWVTDIDAARAYNAKTGALVASVTLPGAVFLNDPDFAPDGSLYITDTGIRFDEKGNMTHPGPDRIFRIAPDRTVSVAAQGDTLERPNGITWDRANNRFVLVAFGGPHVFAWKPGDASPTSIATGPGGYDGVEVVNGKLYVSSWVDSTVSTYDSGHEVKVITGVPSPADIGYDSKRNRILIPIFTGNRVEIWQLP
jgi:sugar lactone lactonase YvrE